METGANDVLVVKGTAESIDREQRLIPWLPDQVVKEVDLDSGLMRVDWDPDF
jgi:16S rRNA processing protein RimM